jgi:hypothetical protein
MTPHPNPLGRHQNVDSLRCGLDTARDIIRIIDRIAGHALLGDITADEAVRQIMDRAKTGLQVTDPE